MEVGDSGDVSEEFLQMMVPLGDVPEWETLAEVEMEGEPSPLKFLPPYQPNASDWVIYKVQ